VRRFGVSPNGQAPTFYRQLGFALVGGLTAIERAPVPDDLKPLP
jgi:hypothetical protein